MNFNWNKSGITTLLITASFALLGIIGMQAYWLRQTVVVKEQQFQSKVLESLGRFTRLLEKREGANLLLDKIDLLSDPSNALTPVGQENLYASPDSVSLRSFHSDIIGIENQPENFNERLIDGLEVVSSFSEEGTNFTSKGRVVVRTAITPQGIRISRKVYQLDSIFQQIVLEGYTGEEPLNERISAEEVDTLLKTELVKNGISLPFVFGLYDNGWIDELSSEGFKEKRVQFKLPIFESDIIRKPRYIGLYFESKAVYILSSIWGVLFIGTLFTVIMVITFGATLKIAFNQKRLSEMKTDFINNMTHEFKTPIATISLALDAMANPVALSDPERLKKYGQMIRQENQRMNRQVEEVLRLAMLDKNELELTFVQKDLHQILEEVIQRFALRIESRGGKLEVDFKAVQTHVKVDPSQIAAVFQNLLENAIKYSPNKLQIAVRTTNVNNQICVEIEDCGMGMKPEVHRQIFEKFYRAESGNVHNIKGHGLGLAFVKSMLDLHQGNIQVKSVFGQGSLFTLNLPIV